MFDSWSPETVQVFLKAYCSGVVVVFVTVHRISIETPDRRLFTREMPSFKLVNMTFIWVGIILVQSLRMNVVVYGACSMDLIVSPGHRFCTRRWWLCRILRMVSGFVLMAGGSSTRFSPHPGKKWSHRASMLLFWYMSLKGFKLMRLVLPSIQA